MLLKLINIFRDLVMTTNNKIINAELTFIENENVPNILIFTEHINATYYISFDIPLKEMHAQKEVNFAVVSQNFVAQQGFSLCENLYNNFNPTLVIITRYALPFGPEILEFFKAKNIPVIYHIDDDLLHIPDSLGEEIQKRQGALDVVSARKYLLQHCDLIYASTEYLAKILGERFPQQKFFHGIYASFIEGLAEKRKPKSQSDPITIGYMGSKGHQQDLSLVEDALVALMEEYPTLRFEVFGTIKMPAKLERFGNRIASHKVNKDYYGFLEHLVGLGWDIGLAPLEEVEFNYCKAPTKYIEYTSAGIPVIATNILVYKNAALPDSILLADTSNWHNQLIQLITIKENCISLATKAKIHCHEKYSKLLLIEQVRKVIMTFAD
jgi:hypothetical protein